MKYDVLIVDGRHLLWRSAASFRQLTAKVGENEIGTGAMYGFLSICVRINQVYGGRMMVAWEAVNRRDNFRYDLYPEYKKRGEMDDDVIELAKDMDDQEKRLKAMLRLAGVRQFVAIDCEADDVIGRLCRSSTSTQSRVAIYSGDSDLRQLVGDHNNVSVISPGMRGKDDLVFTFKDVVEKHGVEPRYIPDLKAIAGDHSDNIPGVPGIGEKGAAKLISALGGVEDVIDASISGDNWPGTARMQSLIDKHRDDVLLYRQLTAIRLSKDMRAINPKKDKASLIKHLMAYRFRSLLSPVELTILMRMGS